ncbi:acetyltransferase (GNAT) family protein [Krasilnikovia cinnamomea]|uniref:Acetyltransferase (GNAT) family protein n=1 Tax=Krasilnikovia cinnamomea TaxID=349313 RepID=A0A4Q7ZVA1_9ACTN|nr:GNAT family N-acetyltransferase [Krasilnikovia cinnamomea]RZU54583.1 acetyltransferase (GNAT) family protein [Krasilnikovia cinnamomea]
MSTPAQQATVPHVIERLTPASFDAAVPGLAEVLADAVAGGASVGFVAPFSPAEAAAWWQTQRSALADGSLAVWASRGPAGISGTISLAYAGKANARHRAEVVKLAVHRRDRGHGLGRRLLSTAEDAAARAGITLLLLDTETASPAERLYLAAGWSRYGIVPDYALEPSGSLRDCSFFYKPIGAA